MRYSASEKAEIIQLVEQSHLPAKRTLDKLGIPRATFYRWYDRYREGGPEADDRRSRPDRVWNRIPDVGGSSTSIGNGRFVFSTALISSISSWPITTGLPLMHIHCNTPGMNLIRAKFSSLSHTKTKM